MRSNYQEWRRERDVETALDCFGARYLSGAQGRFTCVDPKRFSSRTIANSQNWNLYAYVLSNPLASIDPDGREEIKLTITVYISEETFKLPPIIGPAF